MPCIIDGIRPYLFRCREQFMRQQVGSSCTYTMPGESDGEVLQVLMSSLLSYTLNILVRHL